MTFDRYGEEMTDPMGGMFGDIFQMLGQQGPDAWFQTASQLALNVARGDDGDPNPLPPQRQRLEELAPLIGRHVDALLSQVGDYSFTAVNRSELTMSALTEWRPLLEPLTQRPPTLDLANLEGGAMMAQLAGVMGPLFLGFQLGSVAGHFSERSWSLSALVLPRERTQHALVVNNIVRFADEWSLDRDVVFTFALAREFIAGTVLTQPGTGDALRALLLDTVKDAAAAQGDLMTKLQGMMNPENMNEIMANPESLLSGISLPGETAATEKINAATAALAAYFDAAALFVTQSMHGPQAQLAEAWRRYRLTDARGEDAAAALFGVSLQGPHHEQAVSFVATLQIQHGLGVFDAFLRSDGLPTPAELSAPEQWVQRVTTSPLA